MAGKLIADPRINRGGVCKINRGRVGKLIEDGSAWPSLKLIADGYGRAPASHAGTVQKYFFALVIWPEPIGQFACLDQLQQYGCRASDRPLSSFPPQHGAVVSDSHEPCELPGGQAGIAPDLLYLLRVHTFSRWQAAIGRASYSQPIAAKPIAAYSAQLSMPRNPARV